MLPEELAGCDKKKAVTSVVGEVTIEKKKIEDF